jgi:hypothetical protein
LEDILSENRVHLSKESRQGINCDQKDCRSSDRSPKSGRINKTINWK